MRQENITDGLPLTWKIDGFNGEYTTLKLPCGHMFHISMIATQFLVNTMLCVQCRQGLHHKMKIEWYLCVCVSVCVCE